MAKEFMMTIEQTKILLIEDNLAEAELIQEMLTLVRGCSYTVIHKTSLEDGIKYFQAHQNCEDQIDVVLLDLNLPDSSGFDTYKRFSEKASWIPTILLTNMDDEKLALKTVRQGAQDYLVKTELDINLLGRVIRYAIERNRAEIALRESEERYKLAVQGANDGLWDWSLESNCIFYSPRWKEILGFLPDELKDHPGEWLNRIHQQDRQAVLLALSNHWEGISKHFESEHRVKHKDGNYIWVMVRGVAVRDEEGKAYRMAGSFSDITRRKKTEERLIYDALHDALTGLPNRTMFMDRLEHAIKRYKRNSNLRFAVLFLDLDRFKVINDSLGHSSGDELLKQASTVITSCLRASDSAARLGGDEFAILLEDIHKSADAIIISDRIQQALQYPIKCNGHSVVISTSIGIVISEKRHNTPEDILQDADIAMYHAKLLGKARHVVFHQKMRKHAIMRMELENDLRKVLSDEKRCEAELEIVFQPIVALKQGKILGFEALLRWHHHRHNVIMPNEFIPMAEETGLIHALGFWVLRKSCKQIQLWREQLAKNCHSDMISISVNISGKQFSSPDLVDQIEEIIQETGIPPSCLNLEITESLLVVNDPLLISTLEHLRSLGVNLQVDDFGRGFSSFSYLQHLPVNTLKIDSLFIQKLETNKNNSEIIRSIVNLGDSLGLSVIAEGIETHHQLQTLKSLNCQFGQGYYFSKPINSTEAGNLIQQDTFQ